MIHVRPFRAWRPVPHLAHLVGSRSFLQYSAAEIKARLEENPYTFLHVIHADHERAGSSRSEHFDAVRDKFMEFTQRGILQREEQPVFYAYAQTAAAFSSLGIIGVVDVGDYEEGRIKVHEHTLANREELFTDYLQHTGINAEPVLLAMPDDAAIEAELARAAEGTPLFDFTTTDRVRHRYWRMGDAAVQQRLHEQFSRLPALYIADGHHRCASSALLARRTKAAPGTPGAGFMAFIVPERQLHIFNYDRTVSGLNGLSPAKFMDAVKRIGPVRELPGGASHPTAGNVQFLVDGSWHELRFRSPTSDRPVEALDAERLGSQVLGPVLGLGDMRTEPRLHFVPGTAGVQALEHAVATGRADAAFHLRAVSFAQLRAVADSGGCMPPKSTWIEPKLRSGLTIYSLEDA